MQHKATSQSIVEQTVLLGRSPSKLMNSALPLTFSYLQGQSQPMGESNKR